MRELFASPIFDNEEKTRAARFLNAFAWIAIPVLLVMWLVRILIWGEKIGFSMILIASFIVILIGVQVIIRRGHVQFAGVFLVTTAWLVILYQAWESDGLRDVTMVAYLVVIMLASLLLGWRGAFTIGLMSVISIWYFAWLEHQGVRTRHVDDPFNYARDLTVIFFLAGTLIYLLINNLNRSLQDSRLELTERLRADEKLHRELQERHSMEAALSASEEKFRRIFQVSPVAICITTLDEGRLLEANDAYWVLTGYDQHTSIGKTAMELDMWPSPEERMSFIRRILAERSIHNPFYVFSTPQEQERTALAFYELIEIKGQTCILSMFYDISEQKQAQEALRDAEARTRALLTAVPDMIFEISKDGVFKGYIPSSEISPLVPPEQFISRNIRELFPAKIADQTMFALERALATGQLHAFEYGMPPGEETQFFEARVSAVSPELAMIMVRDISQRKWIETEREKLIQELEDKNAELERFTYTVSHDLKSPLITIKGFLGFIEQDAYTGNITRLKADIKRIGDATDKMQLLLNELLELSRIGRLMNPHEHIPFNEIAREAVDLVQGRLLMARVHVRIQKNMPSVYGDKRRLVEVIQNLVDNAAKFTGNKPRPRIEIGHDGHEDGRPIFFVRDNGIGIETEHQDRVFGLFNKLDADSEGTGIGLTLVKRIVEVHGGRIWVESKAGAGATFFFTLQTQPDS
jgi:PAS domain S-box-containing protein